MVSRIEAFGEPAPRRGLSFGLLAALLAGLAWGWPLPALAQEEAEPAAEAEQAEPAPPPVIAPAQVAGRALEVAQTLREIRASSEVIPEIEEIEQKLEEGAEQLAERRASTEATLEDVRSIDLLFELDREWSIVGDRLEKDRGALTKRAEALSAQLDRLGEIEALWERSRGAARESEAPQAVLDGIREVMRDVERTRDTVAKRRAEVLTLQSRVGQDATTVAELRARITSAREDLRGQLLVRDSPPLWALKLEGAGGSIAATLAQTWERRLRTLQSFFRDSRPGLAVQVLLFVAVVALARGFRRRAQEWAGDEPDFEASARILARPVSAALVVALLTTTWVHERTPRVVIDLFSIALIAPVLRLLPGRLFQGMRNALYGLAVFYVLDRAREFFEGADLVDRALLAGESAAGLALLLWLLRPSRSSALPEANAWLRALGIAIRVSVGLFAISLLANLIGNVGLAELLVVGTLFSFYAAVILYAAAQVLDGLASVALRVRPLRLLRMVQRHGALLKQRVFAAIHVGLLLWWISVVLNLFSIRQGAVEVAERVLMTEANVGAIRLSLGDFLLFGAALYAAYLASRFFRFVLEEDVMPRLSLPRGVPYAIGSVVHYGILFFGFLMAAAAAGLELGRFAILAGAFGVGIGFGLQNVVNNFISGLILLFERPIQVGDTIQVGEVFGEVRRIGIRSSTVRTWQGAEVIVPNGNLISESVTNWTLSDRERRVDVLVGVAYGTDPQRVLDLLQGVADEHPDVLKHPAPMVLFKGFGASSLDFELRTWTSKPERWLRLQSELTVAVNNAIVAAGIEIPFPQRDLHLRSVDLAKAPLLVRSEPAPGGGAQATSPAAPAPPPQEPEGS